jgi:geranylgeranyl diphosphate synthase, type II
MVAGDLAPYWGALRERYEVLLADRLDLDPPLNEVARYALAGGKRVRPLLTELVGRVVDAPVGVVVEVAVATEYLHTASMLLDDLECMDDAAERRNAPAAHVRFSEAEAILTAVSLLSRAYALLLEAPTGRPEANIAMASMACATVGRSMAPGQAIELGRAPADAGSVRTVHARKTASLFSMAARLACLCGGANPDVAERLADFATHLGVAYQIVDDVQDRGSPGEARANLARMVGIERSRWLADCEIRSARPAAELDTTGSLGALLDWLEQEVVRASTQP